MAPRTKLPWSKETFVDNRPAGTEHHTYKITPQRGVYGSLFEEDADFILESVNSHAALIEERDRLRAALKTAEEALFWAARQHHENGNVRAQKATELSAHAARAALSEGKS